jgi:geranylgeranyl reductase family protein
MKLWDAIVVGAGPAGCAAAYDMARSGREVLLLDRAEFPRQKACAGGLTLKAMQALRYSIDPVVRERISDMHIERGPGNSAVLRRRSPYCFMTVRQDLDDYCLRQTLAAGANLQRIHALTGIREDSAGITVLTDSGELRTRFLIAADGVHSQVRQLAGLDSGWFQRGFALEAVLPMENAATQNLIFDFAPIRDGYGWIFPKGDHVNIGLYCYSGEEKIDRARLAAYVRHRYGNAARAGDVIGQYVGMGAAKHEITAGKVFLTGDAGGFVDPLTGEGIYFAIASGQAAAEAIESELRSGAQAHVHFAQATVKLRSNLAVATSAARWFYSHLDLGYRFIATPLLQSATLNAIANGLSLAKLAVRVRKLERAGLRLMKFQEES